MAATGPAAKTQVRYIPLVSTYHEKYILLFQAALALECIVPPLPELHGSLSPGDCLRRLFVAALTEQKSVYISRPGGCSAAYLTVSLHSPAMKLGRMSLVTCPISLRLIVKSCRENQIYCTTCAVQYIM